MPARLVTVLRGAKKRQAAERLALDEHYRSEEYVVSNEIGEPYNPAVLSRYWADAVKAAGVRHIKLHGGRHTAATPMHLDGVRVAVIAAWIGHSDPTLTLRVYAHSQDEALKAAGRSLDRPNKSSV
ncbi:tyrosine-type recombinase/integrase [Mycolicibacterium sp. D5.8-2]|nr:tyrosine-type recombinase/integrase [Mycolicibacterium sp. D5.8-2]MDW5612499.1 tyrosine-type recombinase/integrase [Mycolicibacterium sp. D5.8-2]